MNDDSYQCPKCGHEMFAGARFCMRCGSRMDAANPSKAEASDAATQRKSPVPERVSLPELTLSFDLVEAPTLSDEPALQEVSGIHRLNEDAFNSDPVTEPSVPIAPPPPSPSPPATGTEASSNPSNWFSADLKGTTRRSSAPSSVTPSAPAPSSSVTQSMAAPESMTPSPGASSSSGMRREVSQRPAKPNGKSSAHHSSLAATAASSSTSSASPLPPSQPKAPRSAPKIQTNGAREPLDPADLSWDAIDEGFEAIMAPQDPSAAESGASQSANISDQQDASVPEEVSTLFKQMAANQLSPVRDFIIELEAGDTRREWLDLCKPAVNSLRGFADQLSDQPLSQALSELSGALNHKPSNGKTSFSEVERKTLRSAYDKVATLVPDVDALDPELNRREPVIIQSVLQQIPELGKVQLDRIYAAGLTKLSMLCSARPNELSEASGIPSELAEKVVAKFQEFRKRMVSIPPDEQRTGERTRLWQLVATLRSQNEAFEQSSRDWSRDAVDQKRRVRRERLETVLQVNILLARLGEVGMVERLERLSFDRKAEALEEFLNKLEHS